MPSPDRQTSGPPPGRTLTGPLLLAAATLRAGHSLETAERVLTDSDAASLRFEPGMVRWRNIEWPVASLTDLRLEGVTGFGSCSIREPAEEIRALSGRAR